MRIDTLRPMPLDRSTVWIRRPAASRRSGDRLVVVPVDAPDHAAFVSGLAATAWRLLENEASIEDLTVVLAEHWQMAEVDLAPQVAEAIEGLRGEGLLVEVEAST